MNLKDIMNKVRYGEDYMCFQKRKESILENYDKDYKLFHASGVIKDIEKKASINENEEVIADRIITKLENIEDRLYSEKPMSEAYKKMQAASLLEDCSKFVKSVNNRKLYDTMNSKQEIGQIVGEVEYFVENYLDSKSILKESTNAKFNEYVHTEYDYINQVL